MAAFFINPFSPQSSHKVSFERTSLRNEALGELVVSKCRKARAVERMHYRHMRSHGNEPSLQPKESGVGTEGAKIY